MLRATGQVCCNMPGVKKKKRIHSYYDTCDQQFILITLLPVHLSASAPSESSSFFSLKAWDILFLGYAVITFLSAVQRLLYNTLVVKAYSAVQWLLCSTPLVKTYSTVQRLFCSTFVITTYGIVQFKLSLLFKYSSSFHVFIHLNLNLKQFSFKFMFFKMLYLSLT